MKENTKITNIQQIDSDYEREFDKDSVYLLEKRILEEREFWSWYDHVHRKPAQITVINESKTPKDEPEQSNVLPF